MVGVPKFRVPVRVFFEFLNFCFVAKGRFSLISAHFDFVENLGKLETRDEIGS